VYELENVGLLFPERVPTGALYTGQVGYIIGGMRSTKEARVGDTLFREGDPVEPLPGFKSAKPMVRVTTHTHMRSRAPREVLQHSRFHARIAGVCRSVPGRRRDA
jgi:translation elongation factor EF-4